MSIQGIQGSGATCSEEKKTSVDLNKVLRWARKQMRDEGHGVLTVLDLAVDKFDLNTNQTGAIAQALEQEGWS